MATKKPARPTKPKQHTKAEFLKAVSDKTNMTQNSDCVSCLFYYKVYNL